MYKFDCAKCPNKCDGKSKGNYDFESDVEFSEGYERSLIKDIKARGFWAKKTQKKQYPDIEIYDREGGKLIGWLEVKAQRRTFMNVCERLPKADLMPSETVALNRSDLEHYIIQSKTETAPIYLAWVLTDRPCVTEGTAIFFNSLSELEKIFDSCGNKRKFTRRSGKGDVVDGEHRGVLVNYHFSLDELQPFNIDDFLKSL